MALYNATDEAREMDELLSRCKPLVKSLIKYRRADQYIEADELANLVYVKIWKSVRLYDASRGTPFSLIARVTSSVLCSAIGSAWAYSDRYAELDAETFESVFAHNAAEAVEYVLDRVRSIKTPVKEPSELEAQKWLVKSFIDCGFCIRRHQAANARTEVFGVDYVKSRWLFDHSLIAIRRELIGDRRLSPIKPSQLANTRSAGLIRFAKFIPPDDFTRLATLMRKLPPNLILTVNPAGAAAIRAGDCEAVRANLELILNGSPNDRPLFGQGSSLAERAAESKENEFGWLRGGNSRDVRLNVPVELFASRQITTAGFPIGIETFGACNLLTWSACLRAGATLLSGLSRNSTLWSIGALPAVQWVSEIGMDVSADPVFTGYAVSPKRISPQEITKEVIGIHVLLTRSLFGDGTPRRLPLRVSLAKPTSAPLRF